METSVSKTGTQERNKYEIARCDANTVKYIVVGISLILFPCFASICALCISDDAPIYAPNKRTVSHPLFSSMFDVGVVRG